MFKICFIKFCKIVFDKLLREKIYTIQEIEHAFVDMINQEIDCLSNANSFCSEYYQKLHETDCNFMENNWLVEDLDDILKNNPKVILELGCGNGKFARKASQYCEKVIAVDWAKSPRLEELPLNVEFLQRDVSIDVLPQAELTCSADFLEHLPFDVLRETIRKIVESSPCGYHKIACYDDGHSHLSIMSAWKWLDMFQELSTDYKLLDVEFRRGRLAAQVITIGNV